MTTDPSDEQKTKTEENWSIKELRKFTFSC
jgi:hypothetical protein